MIYVGRVCCGVCTGEEPNASDWSTLSIAASHWSIFSCVPGIVCILCPTYVAEIATPNNRGFLGSMVQIMVTIGVLQVTIIA